MINIKNKNFVKCATLLFPEIENINKIILI